MARINRRLFLAGTGAAVGTGLLARSGHSKPLSTTSSLYFVNGVAVHHYPAAIPCGRPPIVMVHGGAHAGWSFDKYATYLSSVNWDCHVLDWYHHGQSNTLPLQTFITRSITAVRSEIESVAMNLGSAFVSPPPYILMGHSMGGLAALYTAQHVRPTALVMIAPVVPAEVNAQDIQLEVNLTQPFLVPPFEQVKPLFFSTMSDTEAMVYYTQLQAESSQAVWEATRWTVSVNLSPINMPSMAVAADADFLTPPSIISTLAGMIPVCRYISWPNIGHSDLLLKESGYLPVVQDIHNWLLSQIGA